MKAHKKENGEISSPPAGAPRHKVPFCQGCGSQNWELQVGRPLKDTKIWEWRGETPPKLQIDVEKESKEERILRLASELEVDQEMRIRLFELLKVHVEPIQ